jgi:hypothetical protein
MKRRILLILWPLLAGLPLLAQTVINRTALSRAVSATDTHIVLVNNAGITAPGTNKIALKNLLIDSEMFEAIEIDPPGTNYIHVTRGVRQSLRTTHQAGTSVWAGPTTAFLQSDVTGTCTRAALAYVPLISISTHRTFDCPSNSGQWMRTDGPDPTSYYGTAIASGAGATVTIPAQTFKISGTSALTTFSVPAGWAPGMCISIIPTGNFTIAATGNVGKASTAVTGKVLKLCWDGSATQLWYPSY